MKKCDRCSGTGALLNMMGNDVDCYICKGKGVVIDECNWTDDKE